ncbi:MAG: M1 family metallopeptidase [Calditrichia bacterium]
MYAYFQQEVNYDIRVTLLPELNRLEGEEHLVYHNNSPDSLSFIYFHLYINRFRKPDIDIPGRNKQGYTEIISLKDSAGTEMTYEIDQTVLKLELKHFIAPGDSQEFHIRFNTLLPPAGDRFGYYGNHYDVGNWYPVPAVYDEMGWHPDQHVNGEFYQEWGNYRVGITVPDGYVVGATGILLNPEVMPDSVEFADRRRDYWTLPAEPVVYRFYASRVHDFAWSADPEFVLRTIKSGDTTIRFFILPYRIQDWMPQLEIAKKVVDLFREKIGPYPYPQLTVVDGFIQAGGIEYPNLVIINDMIYNERDLSATIIHEIAHQWFYGLLANNQTRYGWMDEGFATYFENLGMEQIYGEKKDYINSPAGFWGKYLGYWVDPRQTDRLTYLSYIRSGRQERINLNFDWFQYDPYIPYYQKMSLVISQLQLVMGDSLFWQGIRDYYNLWRFRHPYPHNLYRVFESAADENLQWFFEEWLNTTWECDYSVEKFSGSRQSYGSGRSYRSMILFRRNKAVVMPLDFRIYLSNGETLDYRIPVAGGSNFVPPNAAGISPWKFYKKSKWITLRLPAKLQGVEIDPGGRLMDVNPFNNDTRFWPKIYWYWMHRQYLRPHTDGYTATVFPFLFFNDADGVQIGIKTVGNFIYPDCQHRSSLLLGLRSFRPEADFWFEHPIYAVNPNLHLIANLYNIAGRNGGGSWLQWSLASHGNVSKVLLGWQFRHIYDEQYLPLVETGKNLSYLEANVQLGNWDGNFFPKGWEVNLHGENSLTAGQYKYRKWTLETSARIPLIFRQRLFARFFTGGIYGQPPLQKAFRLGGADAYDYFRNPFLRARGTLPVAWLRDNHLFLPGGGNLRSLAAQPKTANPFLISGNLSLTLGNPLDLGIRYIPYLSDIIFSAFTGWAASGATWGSFSPYFGEAGFTISITRIPFAFHYFGIDQIHIDLPLWANEQVEPDGFKFRWALRIDIKDFY